MVPHVASQLSAETLPIKPSSVSSSIEEQPLKDILDMAGKGEGADWQRLERPGDRWRE